MLLLTVLTAACHIEMTKQQGIRSMLNKQSLVSMPDGMVPLFCIQIVSTLSFSVLYSTLALYIKGKLGLAESSANSIMGVFIAFNFALHLLGGLWGGRLLSNRALFCVGMVAQVVGCLFLSTGDAQYLYWGLASFLTGSGLNVTCVNCMLTQRFTPDDTRRETAFLWNYAGMNIGFFVGFSMSGFFQLTQDYEHLFLLSSLGNIIALSICFASWHRLADQGTAFVKKTKKEQRRAATFGLLCILALPFALSQILQYADWANKLIIVTGVIMLGVILYIALKQRNQDIKNKLFAFAVLMIVSTIFWMLYQIGPMGLTFFIDNNVARVYGHWTIPPQWFQNINTIAIVIGGPVLSIIFNKMRRSNIDINIPVQFAFALLLIGIAFILLPVSIAYANSSGLVSPSWIVLCYLLQSIGELLISPIGYAMIGALAPASLQGVMMGMWMLNGGVGATLSSYSSNLMIHGQTDLSPLVTNNSYSHVFLMLGLFAILSSVVVFLMVPKLKSLMYLSKNKSMSEESSSLQGIERVALSE